MLARLGRRGGGVQEVTQKLLYWFDRFIVEGDDIWISEQGTCYGLVSMPAARLDHFVAMLRECSDCDEWDEQNAFDKELTAAREQKHKRDEAFRKRQAAEEQASRSKPAGQGDQGGGTGGVAAPKPPPAAPAKKFILAVFDIQAKRLKANRSFVDELTDYLAMRLASTGHFEVVPRAALKKRLLESKKSSYRQCFDESCQIELGRELAAEKTLATEILRLGSKCKVTMALYDLKKATADHASTVDGACDEDGLTRSLDKAVEELTRT